jgi:hypothetical protein
MKTKVYLSSPEKVNQLWIKYYFEYLILCDLSRCEILSLLELSTKY